MSEKQPDEADRHKAGTLPVDPKAETRRVAADVPRLLTEKEILNASVNRAVRAKDQTVCTTGYYKLDRITGGIKPTTTWLFGADTSFGKSTWLVAVADENSKIDKRVLIVSTEDTEEMYGDRLMVRRSLVNAMRYRDGKLLDDEKVAVERVHREGRPIPLFVDARRWKVEDLADHLKVMIREHRIDIVAFDYIQEMSSKRRWQDERVKYREIASVCRHTAKSAKIAAIIFSQLTLDDKVKIPTRRNIRECRDIANASEVIVIGFEPDADVKGKDGGIIAYAGAKCVYVDKVKNGPRAAKFPVIWNKRSACFMAASSREHEAQVRNWLAQTEEQDRDPEDD